jgi:allene oxide cyclase-like protein
MNHKTIKFKVAATIGAAVVLSAMGGAYVAANDGNRGSRNQVLHLTVRETSGAQIDAPNPEDLIGLRFVGGDDVFNRSRLVGHAGRSCEAFADLGDQGARFQCVITLALEDGLITAQALVTFTPEGLIDFEAAITGGTGAYRHAQGFVAADQVTETETRLTVDLR